MGIIFLIVAVYGLMAGPIEAPFAFMLGCIAIFIMILLPVFDIIDGVNSKEKSKKI
jgi:uncharacterized oligopeptide transporter (OPT) family protein